MIPANYLQPGGIPGRTLHWKSRGRITTLSTAATLILNIGHAATAATTVTTSWAKTGAMVMWQTSSRGRRARLKAAT